MGKIPYILAFVGLLAACNDGGSPSSGYQRPGNFQPGNRPYENRAKTDNKKITNMTITNGTQAVANIASLLRGYPGTDKNTDNLKIAGMAIQIATGRDDFDGVSADVFKPALYVISQDLYSTCADGANVSTCVANWRAKNSSEMKKRLSYLREWSEPIDISTATFLSTADTELKFTVDDAGNITDITVNDDSFKRDGTTNRFVSGNRTLTYDSGSSSSFKLSYADFGMYNIATDDVPGEKIAFAGGYKTKMADITKIEDSKMFSGIAVGNVTNGDKEFALNGTAQLNVENIESTLHTTLQVGFDNWYGFTVNQTGTENPTIKFTDAANTGFDPTGNGNVSMNVGYYGPDGTPTEAVGTVHYTETDGINMDVAFGVH